jgi:ABC-type glutathione transport system ATPase component
VLARELSRDLSLFVAAQPTRGVDVGSIEFIHKRIVETRDSGIPVIVVSTELDEVSALADRIMVMYRGRIVGIVPGDTPRDVLGLMMAGRTPTGKGWPRERRNRHAAPRSAPQKASAAAPPGKWHDAFVRITQGNALISVLAVVLALIVGGIMIAATDAEVQRTAGYFFAPR